MIWLLFLLVTAASAQGQLVRNVSDIEVVLDLKNTSQRVYASCVINKIQSLEPAALVESPSVVVVDTVDWSHVNLSSVDWSHVNLSSVDWSHVNISNIDWSHVNISNIDWSRINMSSADWARVNMSNHTSRRLLSINSASSQALVAIMYIIPLLVAFLL